MVALVARVLQAGNPLVRNASVAATELIRDAIVEGRLEPGERLKEEELARELGISRTPIREALLILQAEDLVTATPNRGAIVRIHEPEELEDLYDMRALLEGHAARRAADRVSEPELELLRASCDRFSAVGKDDLSGLVRENQFFHTAILDISGSARLASMVRKVIKLPLVYNSYRWYSPEQTRVSVDYHRRLIHAFEARDAERAEWLMKEHVLEARDVLVAGVRAKQAAAAEDSD
jgi:DNA-binding GntR family transcriptional regulator